MANKKISQLTSMGSVGIGSADHFVVSESLGAGNYATVKTSPLQLANYVLNPISATQISGAGKNVFFNNSSWDTAGLGENFPYLQVDIDHGGKLVTGSGISVPAIGDNMGNCVVTRDLYAQGFDFTGCYSFYFGDVDAIAYNARSVITSGPNTDGQELKVQAYTDLTLSGNRHVNISGQALSLENGDIQTPISGNVIITGGNLEIDPGNKLIVNEISGSKAGSDDASITIEGSSRHVPTIANSPLSWADSNIQYNSSNTGPLTYAFTDVADGQTLTMYLENTHASNSLGVKFVSGTFGMGASGAVVWGGEYPAGAPSVEVGKANLYTFVRINTGIFASAVTGYVY